MWPKIFLPIRRDGYTSILSWHQYNPTVMKFDKPYAYYGFSDSLNSHREASLRIKCGRPQSRAPVSVLSIPSLGVPVLKCHM